MNPLKMTPAITVEGVWNRRSFNMATHQYFVHGQGASSYTAPVSYCGRGKVDARPLRGRRGFECCARCCVAQYLAACREDAAVVRSIKILYRLRVPYFFVRKHVCLFFHVVVFQWSASSFLHSTIQAASWRRRDVTSNVRKLGVESLETTRRQCGTKIVFFGSGRSSSRL